MPCFLGEVIGGRQAMAAAADDDDVVGRLRLGLAPGRLPAAIAAERLRKNAEGRIAQDACAG